MNHIKAFSPAQDCLTKTLRRILSLRTAVRAHMSSQSVVLQLPRDVPFTLAVDVSVKCL